METVQSRIRAAVMAGSLAVIVLVGGQAVVEGRDGDAADPSVPAAATSSPGAAPARGAVAARSGPHPGYLLPVVATLERMPGRVPGAPHEYVALRGELADEIARTPLERGVTLWRRTAQGRWKAIITGRSTSDEGGVIFEVAQSSSVAVYRLTSEADGVHAAATSGTLTVRH